MFCTDLQQEGAALHCMLPSCANAILQCNAIAMHACTHRWQPLHKHTKGDEEKKTRSLVRIVAQQDKIESILAPPPPTSLVHFKKKKTLAIWLFALSLHKRHLILWGVFYFTWSQAWAFFLSLSLTLFFSLLSERCVGNLPHHFSTQEPWTSWLERTTWNCDSQFISGYLWNETVTHTSSQGREEKKWKKSCLKLTKLATCSAFY